MGSTFKTIPSNGGAMPFFGAPAKTAAPAESRTPADVKREWDAFWAANGPQAEAAGYTKEQARALFDADVSQGDDLKYTSDRVAKYLADPANRPVTSTQVDPAKEQAVRDAAGLPQGPRTPEQRREGMEGVETLAPPDPVKAAVDKLAGMSGPNVEQQDALAGMKGAGDQQLTGQNDLIAQLQEAARGGGPSAASALFQLALGKSIAAQRASAAGVRGGSAAGASRNAGLAGADMTMQATGEAAALRAQEQQAAQQLLGTTLQQTRAGSMAKAGSVAEIAGQIRGQDIVAQTQTAQLMQAAQQLEQQKREAAASTALSLLQLETNVGLGNQGLANQRYGIDATSDLERARLAAEAQKERHRQEEASNKQLMDLALAPLKGVGKILGSIGG